MAVIISDPNITYFVSHTTADLFFVTSTAIINNTIGLTIALPAGVTTLGDMIIAGTILDCPIEERVPPSVGVQW